MGRKRTEARAPAGAQQVNCCAVSIQVSSGEITKLIDTDLQGRLGEIELRFRSLKTEKAAELSLITLLIGFIDPDGPGSPTLTDSDPPLHRPTFYVCPKTAFNFCLLNYYASAGN